MIVRGNLIDFHAKKFGTEGGTLFRISTHPSGKLPLRTVSFDA